MKELIIESSVKTRLATTMGKRSGKTIYGIWGTRGVNIIAGGYFSLYVGIRSDNRLLWINIYHEYIFGSASPPTRRPTSRNIRMNNSVSQGKYILTVKTILKENNIRDRLKTITDKATFLLILKNANNMKGSMKSKLLTVRKCSENTGGYTRV